MAAQIKSPQDGEARLRDYRDINRRALRLAKLTGSARVATNLRLLRAQRKVCAPSAHTHLTHTTDDASADTAIAHARERCDALWERLQQAQAAFSSLAPPAPDALHFPVPVARQQAYQAEMGRVVDVMDDAARAKPAPTDVAVAQLVARVERTIDQLTRLAASLRLRCHHMAARLDTEKQLHAEHATVNAMLTRQVAAAQAEADAPPTNDEVRDAATRANLEASQMKTYFDDLMKELGDFCVLHFPVVIGEDGTKYMGMRSMLNALITQMLDQPDNPYVPLDDRMYPPYLELLLRANVVQKSVSSRHRDESTPTLIRLVRFNV